MSTFTFLLVRINESTDAPVQTQILHKMFAIIFWHYYYYRPFSYSSNNALKIEIMYLGASTSQPMVQSQLWLHYRRVPRSYLCRKDQHYSCEQQQQLCFGPFSI